MTSPLIEASALQALLEESPPGVKIIDASYNARAQQNFTQARIGNAVYFDIDTIADQNNPLPHMIPSAADFAATISKLGISNNDQIIIYDQTGIFMAATRAWWMFRLFGHDNVRILNGGLPAWQNAELPLNQKPPQRPVPTTFKADFQPYLVKTMADVKKASQDSSAQIIDVRDAQRFNGLIQEPRADLLSGHIPGSQNLFFMDLIDSQTGKLKEKDDIAPLLNTIACDKPLIASCGSGVTACILALALYRDKEINMAIYDGSWTEWGDSANKNKIISNT